jgi:enoyl-CoA hydratase
VSVVASDHPGLRVEVSDSGVAWLTIVGRGRLNVLDHAAHRALNRIWSQLDADPAVRVTVVTGDGSTFCAGGDLEDFQSDLESPNRAIDGLASTVELVDELIASRKPIISAINGPAVGAGLAVALLADVSIIGAEVQIGDGHTKIGLPAGDHAVLLWPLLCGLAKAKYYLLSGEMITGQEAERIGLVSRCVSDDAVLADALAVAERLALGPQLALRATKRALNHWLRFAQPAFEHSAAVETLHMLGDEAKEGFAALLEHRTPQFDRVGGAGMSEMQR